MANGFVNLTFIFIVIHWTIGLISCETYPSPEKLGFAYEFKIHVDASKEECFYQMVQAQSTLYVAFQVMRGGDSKAGFLIRDPTGATILPYKWSENAEHEESSVHNGGYYQFCIDNSLSRFASKLVSLYVASYKRDEWDKYISELTANDVVVSNFTASLSNVDKNIGTMLKSLDQSRRHHSHDWYLVDGNNRYIQNWSIAQCLIIVLSSVVQVFAVKRFFTADEKSSSKGKPRA